MIEKQIKKERKLIYLLKSSRVKGDLVLTTTELYFLSKDKKVFSVPVKDILNSRAEKALGLGMDNLIITCVHDGKEQEIKFQHMEFWKGASIIGNLSQIKEPYFRSWELLIEETRLGKNKNDSGIDNLEKLAGLRDRGIITDEEFTAKKKQILGI